jgi:hypothetical protein
MNIKICHIDIFLLFVDVKSYIKEIWRKDLYKKYLNLMELEEPIRWYSLLEMMMGLLL